MKTSQITSKDNKSEVQPRRYRGTSTYALKRLLQDAKK